MVEKKQMYNDYRDVMLNGSGVKDITAYAAIRDLELGDSDARFKKLLRTMFAICELSDFEMVSRVEIKDKITGKIYR